MRVSETEKESESTEKERGELRSRNVGEMRLNDGEKVNVREKYSKVA